MNSVTRKLVSGSALRVIQLFAQVGVGLFMVPFMIGALGDRSYGLWALVASVIGYYGVVDIGLSQAAGRFLSRTIDRGDVEESNRLFNSSLAIYSILGVAVLGLSVIGSLTSLLVATNPEDASVFSKLILILGINLALSFPVRAFAGVLIASLRFDIASAIALMSLVLRTTLIVWALSEGHGLVAVAWATFLANLPAKALQVYVAKREAPFLRLSWRDVNRVTGRKILAFSFYAFAGRVSHLLRLQTDALVISAFVGLVAVTHYRIASTLLRYYRQLIVACMGVILPLFSIQHERNDADVLTRTFYFSTRISIFLASFAAFGLVAWGGAFIERWVGVEYLDAYPCLVILTVGMLPRFWQSAFPPLLLGAGQERLFAMLAATEGVVNLLATLLLVGRFGIVGVAMGALTASCLINLLLMPVLGCRAMSIPYWGYLRKLSKTIAVSALALAAPLALSWRFVGPSYPILLSVAAASFALYLAAFWLIEFDREERSAILSVVPAPIGRLLHGPRTPREQV
jgi:O-antigen/teichoic acid export membrane protein